MYRPSLRHPVHLIAAVSLIAAACAGPAPSPSTSPGASPASSADPSASGGASPSPSGSASEDAIYAEINEQVRAIRGLDEKKPVVPTIASPDELAEVIQKAFDEDYPAEQVAADEALYKGLGLLPEDAKLDEVYVDLLESQVAGLYDPVSESLYVVSKQGGVGAVEKVYYSHEYDHALQDQHFDLEAIQDGLEDQSDRLLARQSLVEGDAYVTMRYWLQQHLTPAEIGEVLQSAADPEALTALNRVPQIVQAQLLFPALQGTQFATAIEAAEGWQGIDRAFADLPESTEQVIHPDKYASGEAPVEVDLPDDLASRMGDGWSVALENTFGEYQTSVFLGAPNVAAAIDGAAGWGGDRITLLTGPAGAWAIAWRTDWDNADDAAEFEITAKDAVAKAGGPGSVLPGEGGTTRWVIIGSDDAALGSVANALGLAG